MLNYTVARSYGKATLEHLARFYRVVSIDLVCLSITIK